MRGVHPALSPMPLLPRRMLYMFFASPKFAVTCILAAVVLFASCIGLELFCDLLLNVLCEETYNNAAHAVGRILPVVSVGPLPIRVPPQ